MPKKAAPFTENEKFALILHLSKMPPTHFKSFDEATKVIAREVGFKIPSNLFINWRNRHPEYVKSIITPRTIGQNGESSPELVLKDDIASLRKMVYNQSMKTRQQLTTIEGELASINVKLASLMKKLKVKAEEEAPNDLANPA